MAKMSISVVKGRGSMSHNNREFTTPNVDKNRVKDNITYKAEPIEQAYEICFSQSIEEYNSKQKRADRRIAGAKGYMEQIKKSKNGEKLFYEVVVQVGNKFDCAVGTENGILAKKALDEYMQDFQHRNPNLYVFNAVLHMDEATPHLHIDYIPLAHGYQRGMQVRNSLDKALKEQGIDGKANKRENSTHNWQESEKDALEHFMRIHGLIRADERGLKREHMSIDQYKAIAEQIHNEVREMPKSIDKTPTLLNKERVTVNKSDLEELEERAKLSLVHERVTKQIADEVQQHKDYNMRESLIYRREAEEMYSEATIKLNEAKKLYNEQKELNTKHKQLVAIAKNLQAENEVLKRQNDVLRAERDKIDEMVQEAVKPLKKQIESLTERLKGLAQSLTNVIKAVGMLKHDKGKYKANLTAEQGEVIDAVTAYAKYWIDKDLENSPESKLMQTEIDGKAELSKGIKQYMTPDYPEVLIYKTGNKGRGFYSKDGKYYGKLDILPNLKKQGVIIKDPYELIPSGRGR